MKLLVKTSLNFFLLAVTVLAVGGCLLYSWMHKQIADEIYEQLNFEVELIGNELAAGGSVSFPFVSIEDTNLPLMAEQFGDTLIYDSVQHEPEGYYYLKKTVAIREKPVQITVMTTYIGWSEYAHMIFYTFLAVACLFCVFGLLINYRVNRRIWRPFFANVQLLQRFSVSSDKPTPWEPSRIAEFSVLQQTLEEMTGRSRREYLALREFTENASHEIQTPLSIMRSALEQLSQQEINGAMSASLVDAKGALDRLSAVNRKLLLLARLENNYFSASQTINLSALLQDKIELMEDLFSQKGLRLEQSVQQEVMVQSDPYVAETLVLNLLSNMLRYTPRGGKAAIAVTHAYIRFSNEGEPLPFPPDRLFERFKKGSPGKKSTGLGLAIVKQACGVNNWSITYQYLGATHQITVAFG